MMRTNELDRRRFQLVAAEFLVRMGDRIRTQRENLGLSRPDVARLMPGKVSENQIYRWELGKHQPKADTLEALAAVLETTTGALMAPEPDKSQTPDPFTSPEDAAQLDRIEQRLDQVHQMLTQLLASEIVAGLQEPSREESSDATARDRQAA